LKEYGQLGKYLKAARLKKKLSQAELAKTFRLHGQFVSNWERGLCAPPKHCFQKVIEFLELDRSTLVEVMIEDSKRFIRSKVYPKRRSS
jgi:transcriptional regulator with XRE-family HTH domain